MTHTSPDGTQYEITAEGAIRQLNPQPFNYDASYCATYDTEAYRRGNETLQALRLGFINGAFGGGLESIADIGYGNGAFLKFAKKQVPWVTGYDVTGVQVDGIITHQIQDHYKMCEQMMHHDVVTFFDCLEHIPDLGFLPALKCSMVVISLPNCHARAQGWEWFDNKYKHRKPNEHVWHFDPLSLTHTVKKYGYALKSISVFEDIVRKSEHGFNNILTAAFTKI